jgi:hypothetical protein
VGHEDAFPRPRLNARCRFSQGTFAGTRGNGRDAPLPAIQSRIPRCRERPDTLSRVRLLACQPRAADAVAVERLVVVHRHRDLEEGAGKREGRLIEAHRRAAVAADIEPRP